MCKKYSEKGRRMWKGSIIIWDDGWETTPFSEAGEWTEGGLEQQKFLTIGTGLRL